MIVQPGRLAWELMLLLCLPLTIIVVGGATVGALIHEVGERVERLTRRSYLTT